jgi:hypothetical protein
VIVFDRSADGRLTTPAKTYATGGTGTGTGLGNQGSVILTNDHRRLYVVNAGSDDISAFAVGRNGLELIGNPVSSGGTRPISLTVHGDLLYVLNAAGSGGIAGFRIGTGGAPTPIPGSIIQPLGGAGPAQIQFSPDGRILVVTEKATNTISTYTVGSDGVASGPNTQASAGNTPFGFNFNQRGDLVVSEAQGGPPNLSTASSYRLDRAGNLELISGQVATTQLAACWIAISQNGKFAYTRQVRLHHQHGERHDLQPGDRPRRHVDAARGGGRHRHCALGCGVHARRALPLRAQRRRHRRRVPRRS